MLQRRHRNEKKRNFKETRGRKKIISQRQRAKFLRTFRKLREGGKNPTVADVMREAGALKGSYRTHVRILNEAGYKKLAPRKKGLLSNKDRRIRKKFAREALKLYDDEFWSNDVAFYLDGVSFVHKFNPFIEASRPRGRVWRKPSEGLRYTTTGSKDLPGGRRVHFMVAITNNQGVILAEPYEKMTGEYFADFVRRKLPRAFIDARIGSRKFRAAKLFVMDNDPSQNSKAAREAIDEIRATLVKIPARSPDLNPIENIFHNVKRELHHQALDNRIKKETFRDFSERIKKTLFSYDRSVINRTIATIPKRLRCIKDTNGNRTRY